MTPRLLTFHAAAAALTAAIALRGASAAPTTATSAGREGDPPNPRRAMIATLGASAPHPSLGDQARLFDRFVGTWDCDFGFHLGDGTVRRLSGEILFGWVLDGRAMQDIWITNPTPGSGAERKIGTTVRTFDRKAGLWRVVFVAASYGSLITLQGGSEGDRIVLRGKDIDGSELRWSFNEIQPDSFLWRGESSRDGGKAWRLEEEHRMRRRHESAAAR